MHLLDIIYLVCLSLGGVYSLMTLLMGGLSHASGQAAHLSHSLHLPEMHAHHGGHTTGGHHAAHTNGHHAQQHTNERGTHDPENAIGRFSLFTFLNPTLIAGFCLGFGGAGMVSRLLGTALNLSLLFAFVGAMTLWTGAFWLITQVFGKAEGTSHNRRHELIGLRAQVTVPIVGNKPGMIAYTVSGSRQSLRAVTEEDEPIPAGAVVRIRRIEESTALVVRMDR